MTGRVIAGLCRLVCGTTVQWRCDPYEPVQRIYFGNHSSHLDFVVIWSALPVPLRRQVRPVAARAYWQQNAIRRHLATNVFNAVLVDRGSEGPTVRGPVRRSAQREVGSEDLTVSHPSCAADVARATTAFIAAEMREAYSLILFPEGTRGSNGTIGPFKSGLYFLSQTRPDVELIPVYLENLNRILPKGEALPVPMLSRVIFGPPLPSAAHQDKAQFLAQARAAVVQLGGHHGAQC